MNNELVAIMALIAAANARIAGMQAKNYERQQSNYALAYDEDDFFDEAHRLELLAISARSLI